MSFLDDSFGDVQAAISNGTFDPQGANATTFNAFPVNPAGNPNNNDIVSGIMRDVSTPMPAATSAAFFTPEKSKEWFGGGVPLLPDFGKLDTLKRQAPDPDKVITDTIKTAVGGGLDIAQYFVRTIVVVLGFIFVAVGLTVMGAKSKIGREVLGEVKKVIPR